MNSTLGDLLADIERLHAMGLDPRFDDVLTIEDLSDGDPLIESFESGCHYDYETQTWEVGQDHAHYATATDEVLWCGGDLRSCLPHYADTIGRASDAR